MRELAFDAKDAPRLYADFDPNFHVFLKTGPLTGPVNESHMEVVHGCNGHEHASLVIWTHQNEQGLTDIEFANPVITGHCPYKGRCRKFNNSEKFEYVPARLPAALCA